MSGEKRRSWFGVVAGVVGVVVLGLVGLVVMAFRRGAVPQSQTPGGSSDTSHTPPVAVLQPYTSGAGVLGDAVRAEVIARDYAVDALVRFNYPAIPPVVWGAYNVKTGALLEIRGPDGKALTSFLQGLLRGAVVPTQLQGV